MQRVVVVGAGFAGFQAARQLCRRVPPDTEVLLINPDDYFLYLPLLPEVFAGILDPRRIAVPLSQALPEVRLLLGEATRIDAERRCVDWSDVEGRSHTVDYDHLLLACGSVNKLLPIPGVAEYAHGFRSLAEAVHLRDHVMRQIELADATDDDVERATALTFVVIGAGYTGTEVASQGARLTRDLVRQHPRLRHVRVRWLLVDQASRVLPGLGEGLAATAADVLGEQGVEIRTGTSVREATMEAVELSDGETVPTRTLIWCVGVQPDPLVRELGLPTEQGRLVVDPCLRVPGHPGLWACGDAGAVPDLARPGELTGMTAQHAQRQGARAGRNIAAALTGGRPRRYKHRNLGWVVDLGGTDAAADPLGIQLGGVLAKTVTRGYHLLAMPTNRLRVALQWSEHALLGPQELQLNLADAARTSLATEEPRAPQTSSPAGTASPAEGPAT